MTIKIILPLMAKLVTSKLFLRLKTGMIKEAPDTGSYTIWLTTAMNLNNLASKQPEKLKELVYSWDTWASRYQVLPVPGAAAK
jgi:hypothetical protein